MFSLYTSHLTNVIEHFDEFGVQRRRNVTCIYNNASAIAIVHRVCVYAGDRMRDSMDYNQSRTNFV